MNAKLIILGCGNSMGVPRIDGYWGKCNRKNKKNIRSRCSAIIQKGSNSILIDTSPDIRDQFISNKIKNLSSVIYTHEHADQTNGLFELRPFTFSKSSTTTSFLGKPMNTKNKINIYGNIQTISYLKKRFDYCFKSKGVYYSIVKANIIKKKFSLGKNKEKVYFDTLSVIHGSVISLVYIFEKTAYISDCNDMSIVNKKELKNLNYLILDCLRIKPNHAHFNLEECLFIHNKLKPKKTFLTNLHNDLDYNFLLKTLPKNVLPAYDGLKIQL